MELTHCQTDLPVGTNKLTFMLLNNKESHCLFNNSLTENKIQPVFNGVFYSFNNPVMIQSVHILSKPIEMTQITNAKAHLIHHDLPL